jgi:hypothetical protein
VDTQQFWYLTYRSINGRCYNPLLTVIFEEGDLDGDHSNEYFTIYDADQADISQSCSEGSIEDNCGSYVTCLQDYPLLTNSESFIEQDETYQLTVEIGDGVTQNYCPPNIFYGEFAMQCADAPTIEPTEFCFQFFQFFQTPKTKIKIINE